MLRVVEPGDKRRKCRSVITCTHRRKNAGQGNPRRLDHVLLVFVHEPETGTEYLAHLGQSDGPELRSELPVAPVGNKPLKVTFLHDDLSSNRNT